MLILDKLYRGEISPIDKCPKDNFAYDEAFHRLLKAQNIFVAMLQPETEEQYEKLTELEREVDRIAEEEMFVDGFRTGVRMMLDALSNDYDQRE